MQTIIKSVFVFIIFSILLFFAQELKANTIAKEIRYSLRWDGKSSSIKVKMVIPTLGLNELILTHQPNPFASYEDRISEFKVLGKAFLKEAKMVDQTKQFIIDNRNAEDEVEVSYVFDGANQNDAKTVGLREALTMHHSPNIKKDFLYLMGRHFGLYLTNRNTKSPLKVSIQWEEVPHSLINFNSVGNKSIEESMLEYSLFSFSKDLKVEKFSVKNIPHYFIGDTVNSNHEKIKKAIVSVTPEVMRFFDDYDFDSYFFHAIESKAIPAQDIRMYGRDGILSAEALPNGFVGTYIGSLDLKATLTPIHESIHRWINSLDNTNFGHLWFGEGFTEYVTLFTAFSSDFLTPEEFIHILNEQFSEYYGAYGDLTNEIRSNEYIKNNIRGNQNLMHLNYSKGFVFAFFLDNQIRLSSNGSETFRDLMVDYINFRKPILSGKVDVKNLTLESFKNLVSKYIKRKDIDEYIQRYILDGEYIDFKEAQLMKEFTLSIKDEKDRRTGNVNQVPKFNFTDRESLKKSYRF
ncbi:MAG TPA: hypothetical protein DDE71_07590 [Tenacibaculum sp.]|nr:hypothetical protein [Tenacibaculum sp.]